ncbi:MAG: CoA-binding protein [Candidatus Micrarchaeota archaeon]|nr:CoA-binding protein [Candidatus Micrarchaeota archaeon]
MDFFSKQNAIAVIGFSRDRAKYGYRVYMTLKGKGYDVYPVNPNASEIGGIRVYPNIREIPKKADVAIIVTKPEVTEKVIEEIIDNGTKMVWMQPGSESEKAIKRCREKGIECISKSCFILDGLKTEFMI